MKLSKSLSILSWVYMGLALFILLVVAKLLPVNAQWATRTLQIDMVMFLIRTAYIPTHSVIKNPWKARARTPLI